MWQFQADVGVNNPFYTCTERRVWRSTTGQASITCGESSLVPDGDGGGGGGVEGF